MFLNLDHTTYDSITPKWACIEWKSPRWVVMWVKQFGLFQITWHALITPPESNVICMYFIIPCAAVFSDLENFLKNMPQIDCIGSRYVTKVILNHTEPGFNQLQNWKNFNSANLCLTVFIRVSTGRASSGWGSLNFWGTLILSLNKAGFFFGSNLNRFNGGLS